MLQNEFYENATILLCILIISVFSSFLGLVFIFIISLIMKRDTLNDLLVILILLFLSYLNLNKKIEGDLELYSEWYNRTSSFNIVEYLQYSVVDYIFHIFLYIHALIFNDFHLFVFFCTSISYFLYYYSLKKLLKQENMSTNFALLIFIIFSFTNEIFSISAHLMRQFMAAGFLSYAIVQTTTKKRLILYFISCLIHFSIIIFFPIFILKICIKDFKKLKLLFIFTSILLYMISIMLFNYIGAIESGISFITNLTGRFSQQVNAENGSLGIAGFLLIIIYSIILIFLRPNENNKYLILLSLYLNCLLFVVFKYKLLLLRFFMYIYFILPLTLPAIQRRFKIKIDTLIIFFAFLIMLRFSFFYLKTPWNYGINDNLFIKSFIIPIDN